MPSAELLEVPAPTLWTPDVAHGTLGRTAVSLHAAGVNQNSAHIEVDLQSVQEKMQALDEPHSEAWDNYCESLAPAFLQEGKIGNTAWTAWLGNQATDVQLLGFLRQHIRAIEHIGSAPAVTAAIDRYRTEYIAAIPQGISKSWLHPDAENAILKISEARVYPGDLFSTRFKGRDGYCDLDNGDIVAAPVALFPADEDYKSILFSLKLHTPHEFTHLLGMLNEVWLNEAVAEHITESVKHGEPDILMPNERSSNLINRYASVRQLLAKVLTGGSEVIPVALATRALSESSESHEAKDLFEHSVDRSWAHVTPDGKDGLARIHAHVRSLQQRFSDRGVGHAAEAAADITRRDLSYQPEVVFGSHPDQRSLVLA